MKKNIGTYYAKTRKLTRSIAVTNKKGNRFDLESGFKKAIEFITGCAVNGGKLIFIGNGASASIASHMAADFWKNGKIRAVAFNDAALLTCVSNDFSYSKDFKKPIEMFADSGDVLVAISSSGKSENIIKGARMALEKGCTVVTLSGFKKDNALRYLGDINFYVPASSYGQIEVLHHSICHCLLDNIVCEKGNSK
ncbi:MAG: SIS domain-containing protein [Candidatus Omnitrophica bacterium]|nr:SIS domain-containing protein [Candidatus Omnitrophota bacterium]